MDKINSRKKKKYDLVTARVRGTVVFHPPLFAIEQKMIIFEVRAKPKNAENNYGALTYCEYLECFIVVWNDNDLASEAVITILCH